MIHGAWDPLLRRIELFGVAMRSDAELVATFVHELLHAVGDGSARELDEESLHRRAVGLVAGLGPLVIEKLAAQLRACCIARPHGLSEKAEGATPPSLPGRGQQKGADSGYRWVFGSSRAHPPGIPPGRGDGRLRRRDGELCRGDGELCRRDGGARSKGGPRP